jgi:hypothetical protein
VRGSSGRAHFPEGPQPSQPSQKKGRRSISARYPERRALLVHLTRSKRVKCTKNEQKGPSRGRPSGGRFGFGGQGEPTLLGVIEPGLGRGQIGTDSGQLTVVGGSLEQLSQAVAFSGQPSKLLVELT